MTTKETKEMYEKVCNVYAELFEQKHQIPFDGWVRNRVGECAYFGDYVVDMATIKTDIDESVSEIEFYLWNDYCLKAMEFNLPTPNFYSWIKGCPRTSEDVFDKLRVLKKNLVDLVEEEKNKNEPKSF